jgi:hypothetical protein
MLKVRSEGDRVILSRTTTDEAGKESVESFSVSIAEANSLLHGPYLCEALIAAKEHCQKALIDRATKLELEARQLRQAANSEAEKQKLKRLLGAGMRQ